MSEFKIGENISCSIDPDNILTLKINLNKELRDSNSGKSKLIATTGKPQKVLQTEDKAIYAGVNIFKYK